ncbi:MAG: hypothetical protein DRJ97_03420 [Thermoprotei archaeon]|nr:MAG: hypothetical protein DRJ97_03420 [Thermoprotei archaeon]
MRLELTVKLPDKPGELLKVLEALASEGVNIVSIVHEREKAVEEVVPVDLVVELPSHVSAQRVREALESKGVTLVRIEEAVEKVKVTAIAVGKVNSGLLSKVKLAGFEGEVKPSGEGAVKLAFEGEPDEVRSVIRELKREIEERCGILILPIGEED